jgi:phosphate-selective porin OprO and OprP
MKHTLHMMKVGLAVALGLAVAPSAMSGSGGVELETPAVVEEKASASIFDTIWGLPVLYSSKTNPIVQKVNFIGRYHGQYYAVDADEFGSDDDWDNRRARFGLRADLFNMVRLHGQMNLDLDNNVSGFFDSVEDLYIEVKPSDAFGFLIGKDKMYLTREWSISSNNIKTMERSLLVNQIIPDKIYQASVFGSSAGLNWRAGVASGSYSDRWELPEFNAGFLANASLGYDVGEKGEIRFDYLYNDGDPGNRVSSPAYEHSFSLNYNGEYGRLGVTTDLIYATGQEGVSDVYGLVLMPYYKITDQLEGVFRYHYAGSNSGDGIRLASRYDRRVDNLGADRGDNYHAFYLGANYYIYGDKLKLMTGVEYSTADLRDGSDWKAWTWVGGVRLHF